MKESNMENSDGGEWNYDFSNLPIDEYICTR